MWRNNYSAFQKKIFPAKDFFFGRPENFLDFVVDDAGRFAAILGLIDLEVGEKSWTLLREELYDRHGAATDLELGTLARAELQHRPPRPRVGSHDDFRLRRIRQNSSRRLTRHLPAVDFVRHPA